MATEQTIRAVADLLWSIELADDESLTIRDAEMLAYTLDDAGWLKDKT